jgi:hypothetical protein
VAFAPRNGLEQLVYDIGQRLGQVMVDGLRQGLSRAAPVVASASASSHPTGLIKRGPGRPKRVGGPAACLVPGCGRRGVAKGLCATHYRKARRLKFGETLSTSQLNELAQDGRKTRFSKKAA